MTREELHNLNHYQLEIIHKYCDDDLHELKKICNRIIRRKNDVFQKDYDDIYDDGMKVLLESVLSYNSQSDISFEIFLKGNLKRSFWEYSRDAHRQKRANIAMKDGKMVIDKETKVPISIPDFPLDSIDSKGVIAHEKIQSDFNLDEELGLKEEIIDKKKKKRVEKFLENISKRNRRIAELIMEGYSPTNIMDKYGIPYSRYQDAISEFRLYENICILLKDEGK